MDRRDLTQLRSLEELRGYRQEIRDAVVALNREHDGQPFPDEARAEHVELTELEREVGARIVELEARQRQIANWATNDVNTERQAPAVGSRPSAAQVYDLADVRTASPEQVRERAFRAVEVEKFPLARNRAYGNRSNEELQEHVDFLLRERDDEFGTIARRVLATGNPHYRSGFAKMVANKQGSLTTEEQRALSVGTGSAGGFAVPYLLDPTVIPTSNLSVNPFRAICRVDTIPGNEWRGVTSAGVTATYAAEATEAADNSPVLAQPSLLMQRAQAFVPVSIELTQDWGALQSELAQLIQDAKDDLEATKFTVGSGTNEPTGLITGATNTVTAGGVASFAIADIYALEQALPPRFRPRAQWIANRFAYNKVRQFDTGGGASMWMGYPNPLQEGLTAMAPRIGNIGANLIGYPANEDSAMASALTTGSKILTIGDPRYYIIVDRVGLDIEVIPHLFGATNRYPTGQRGFYAFWRNNARVLDPNGFRVLVTG